MSTITSREIRLASRPSGIPTAANFTLVGTELQPVQDQQVLVRNRFMLVDTYMRNRMNEGKSYKFLREECGVDQAFDYKAGPVLEQLYREAPDGIDVYFDNVGGEMLEAALSALRVYGPTIACGGIAG